MNNMSERCDVNPNNLIPGADWPHSARYFLARGFVKNGETVVDAACGTGYGSKILSEVASNVLAIDKDDSFYSRWRTNKIGFMKANLEELDEYPQCDVWVSFETIEHLADPQKYLDKVTQATRRCIIMSSPDYPTTHLHCFHLSDVLFNDFGKMMGKYQEDWLPYHSFKQGYCWIAIYVKKGTIWLN